MGYLLTKCDQLKHDKSHVYMKTLCILELINNLVNFVNILK